MLSMNIVATYISISLITITDMIQIFCLIFGDRFPSQTLLIIFTNVIDFDFFLTSQGEVIPYAYRPIVIISILITLLAISLNRAFREFD